MRVCPKARLLAVLFALGALLPAAGLPAAQDTAPAASTARPLLADRYVRDAGEYKVHMSAHRARLVERAAVFKDPLFVEFMKIHDESKFQGTVAEELMRFYGVNLWGLEPRDPAKIAAYQTIGRINATDRANAMVFFRTHPGFLTHLGRLNSKARSYLTRESLLDVVDTRMDPVRRQELAIPAWRTVDEYFRDKPRAIRDLVSKLKATYPDRSGHDYETMLRESGLRAHPSRDCSPHGLAETISHRLAPR